MRFAWMSVNAPAIRLYEQCGFACAGTAEMHFCVGTVDPCRLYENAVTRTARGKKAVRTGRPRVRILLHRIAAACRNTLGDTLAGVYVHGSLAVGCFCWTQSDIDFLVAVRRPLSQAQKEALLRALLALEPDAPSKGLEMSAVLEAYCRSFIHPAPYELHYSPMHRARCLRDLPAYCAEMHGADPDLAAHFTVARAVGLTLWGRLPKACSVLCPARRIWTASAKTWAPPVRTSCGRPPPPR
ncbi:MAG: hypothetical protein ACLRRT_06195 [Ruthenibacterium lactatiformans]